MKKKARNNRANNIEFRGKTQLNDQIPFGVKEAYKLTRTNVLFSLAEEGGKCIAITSAFAAEGKTTTATNMALSFVQLKKRTLLIDGDMRKPQIHNMFGVDNQVGLSNVLGGFVETEEAIHKLESGLHVMTAGHIPPNPVELLGSLRMKSLLEALGEHYEYIFIDTPPINLVSDAIVLSESLSGVIMVVRQNQSKHPHLEGALSKLNFAKAKVLGIILTGVSSKSGKYGKYGKYSQYKGYEAYE